MNFFSTFTDINKNRGNFKRQEQANADEQAKRDKYFEQHKPSASEKKEADEFRRVVINAVDIMDTESENKAESMEQAVEQSAGPIAGLGIMGAMLLVLKNANKAKNKLQQVQKDNGIDRKINNSSRTIIEDLKNKKLIKDKGISPRLYNPKNWGALESETKDFLEKNVTEDLIKASKKLKLGRINMFAIPIATTFVLGTAIQIAGTILQIKASRVGRFQARQELKDPLNFVEYNDQQKAEAEKVIDTIYVPDNDKNDTGSYEDIKKVLEVYKDYQKESKKLDEVTLSSIAENDTNKAYGRQRVLNRATRKINNDAENYSEDIETAAAVIMNSSFLGGLAFGKLADLIMGKPKNVSSLKAASSSSTNIFSNPKIFSQNRAATAGILASFLAAPLVTRFQKDAARAGRFQAKRDLESDPNSFIDVPDEELVKINAKGKVQKDGFFDGIKSIPKTLKLMKDYKKYKKTELKKEKAMTEALKRLKVTDKQLDDAKSLQMRIFKSFDTIDDHSQKYSEDMEAACEITREAIGTIQPIAMFALPAMIATKPQKFATKITGAAKFLFEKANRFVNKYADGISKNIINKIDNKITESHFYQKLKPFENKINAYVKEKDNTKAAQIFNELNHDMRLHSGLSNYVLDDLFLKKGMQNTDHIEDIINNDELRKTLNLSEKDIEAIKDNLKNNGDKKILPSKLEELRMKNQSGILETVNKLAFKETLDKNKLKAFSQDKNGKDLNADELRKKYTNFLKNFKILTADFSKISDEKVFKIRDNMMEVINNIPKEKLDAAVDAQTNYFKENPTKLLAAPSANLETLSGKDIFLTKELKPIAYAVGGTFIAGSIGISYAIENWLTSLQKKAGRLGVESAINELNQENEKFKAQNKGKQTSFEAGNKPKTLAYFELVKAKKSKQA